jgi:hypothetical protein
MSFRYIDESRDSSPHALPDVEVFHSDAYLSNDDPNRETEGIGESGFYYAYGFPGCMWDSEPVGPFGTEDEALTAARKEAGYCEHGVPFDGWDELDHSKCDECPAPELWALEFDPLWYAASDGRTCDPTRAMAWISKEAAERARDRMAFCDGAKATRLSDDVARQWGRV